MSHSVSRIAVLASGGGSNLQSILDHFSSVPVRDAGAVVLVASNRAESGAITRAEESGIATHVIGDFADGAALLSVLQAAQIDLLVLAGYLKLVPAEVVHAFKGRMLNVHPAMLPAFGGHGMYGQRVHEAVIASGARFTGVTVHFVDEEFDRGAIAAQWPVPVLSDDTPQTLAARVLRTEHAFFPVVIEAVAAGQLVLGPDNRVVGSLPALSAFAPRDAQLFFRPV